MPQKKKWLVITNHDERYDFNLEMSVFRGSLEELEKAFLVSPDGKGSTGAAAGKDGVVIYHTERREAHESHDDIDVVRFWNLMAIPYSVLRKDDFFLYNPVVVKNRKFGFLDEKKAQETDRRN